MQGFEYLCPTTLPEALRLLENYGDRARILAGGTDLLVQMQTGELKPRYIIDLKRIGELQGVHPLRDGAFTIGPLTRIADLASLKDAEGPLASLREAARTIGSVQIRNRATIGGNICRAAPSADMVPLLLVLEGEAKIVSLEHERWISVDAFFKGPGQTILLSHEVLAEVRIPSAPPDGWGVYKKLGPRQTMDLATVGVAVYIQMSTNQGICQTSRIALASVAPTPMRARETEKMLGGKPLTPDLISKAARSAAMEASPITDVYGPDWYKKQMVEVLTKRAIGEALARIRGKHET